MSRAFLLVLDSLGIGATPDADRFGDVGADTLGHIAQRRAAAGRPLACPNLARLGLGEAARLAGGAVPPGLSGSAESAYGAAREISRGKDTPSGHWEMAGAPVTFDWGYFPKAVPTFPAELTAALVTQAELPGLLGNCHASGTEIIEELGAEHVRSGRPIVYTSADSVFQIAAHEEAFGLERLYALCETAFRLVAPWNIGRVIARPFTGGPGTWKRTANRRDYAVEPPSETLLDRMDSAGRQVVSVGKIGDIFAHRGTGTVLKGDGNMALFDRLEEAAPGLAEGGLAFANFVDFDQNFGHRRDVEGYAAALEAFDARLPAFEAMLRPGDIAIMTADHGCDPTWPGSDHTREHVPVLGFGPGLAARSLGIRDSFADIGQSIATHLGVGPLQTGRSFL